MARDGARGDSAGGAQTTATTVDPGAPSPGPRFFAGSFEHAVDEKNRLVLPAVYRPRLNGGAYLGPLDGFLGLWPDDQFDTVLQKWSDGIALGMVSEQVFEAFMAATNFVQPDGQGRISVHKDLRAAASLDGPVVVLGAVHRIAIWARDRWELRQQDIPGSPSDAIGQAHRDLKL